MDINRCIGKDNGIPWHLPADLKYFKAKTFGHCVVMGRKCWESMGEKPLKGRTNIILTRKEDYQANGAIVVHTLEDALKAAEQAGHYEVFIIGGGEIYALAMPYVTTLYVTEVDTVVEGGDVFFPEIEHYDWPMVSIDYCDPDVENKYSYWFYVYEKTDKPITWVFKAYQSGMHYKLDCPFFTKIFHEHTEMKNFSANHSAEWKPKFKDYCSGYWPIEFSNH